MKKISIWIGLFVSFCVAAYYVLGAKVYWEQLKKNKAEKSNS